MGKCGSRCLGTTVGIGYGELIRPDGKPADGSRGAIVAPLIGVGRRTATDLGCDRAAGAFSAGAVFGLEYNGELRRL